MGRWLALGVAGAAFLAAFLARPLSWAPAPPATDLEACRAAQQAVAARAVARFPACAQAAIRRIGPGRWQVEGDFETGEHPGGYAATVEQRPGGFTVTDLKIRP